MLYYMKSFIQYHRNKGIFIVINNKNFKQDVLIVLKRIPKVKNGHPNLWFWKYSGDMIIFPPRSIKVCLFAYLEASF